jgi:hypothetical protein
MNTRNEPAPITEALKQAHQARSFRPFSFQLANGREIPVPHPGFLAFNGKSRTALVVNAGDGFDIVELLLVESLRFEGEHAQASSTD